MENIMNSPFLFPKHTPYLLPLMKLEGMQDWSWQGQNSPALLPEMSKPGDFCAKRIGVKMA